MILDVLVDNSAHFLKNTTTLCLIKLHGHCNLDHFIPIITLLLKWNCYSGCPSHT